MENLERRIGTNRQEEKIKLFLNDKDDFIFIDPNNSGVFDRLAEFTEWIEKKRVEQEREEKEVREKNGAAIAYDEEGNISDFNATTMVQLCKIRTDSYREACAKMDSIFGPDTCKKYFRDSYENDANFVPDDICLLEFLEDITPVFNEVFQSRKKKIDLKYNSARKGGVKNKYRTK